MDKSKRKAVKVKSKIKLKNKPKKISLFFIFSIFIAVFAVIFVIYNFNKVKYENSLLLNETIGEIKNKTIPDDVKKAIKQKQKTIEKSSSSSSAVFAASTYEIPILMYHYVEYVKDKGDTIRISLDTTPYVFEQQIKTLLDAGYVFITTAEISKIIDGKYEVPFHSILLTFDDGYRDFYTDVLPVLKKYNVKATAYIISGFLNRPNYMTDEQLKEVIDSGLVEIGAHTVNHIWLKGRSFKDVTNEVVMSKIELEKNFQIQVDAFAYPFGAFDQQAIDIVKSVGFKTATSTIPGIDQNQDNKFFLNRLRPGGRTGKVLLNWLVQKTFHEYY